MALVVQKYGGTSVGDIDKIKHVANRVKRTRDEGHDVVVVVSAMAGETNRLVDLCRQTMSQPDPREYDVVVSTGEQVTIGLLAMALKKMGQDAVSMLGSQIAIHTDNVHSKARIVRIDSERIFENLKAVINYIADQMPHKYNNIKSVYIKTTMGRPVKIDEQFLKGVKV